MSEKVTVEIKQGNKKVKINLDFVNNETVQVKTDFKPEVDWATIDEETPLPKYLDVYLKAYDGILK